MPIVKASELAYCRFQLPDLELAEQFLVDFGLMRADEQDGKRYYRGTDPHPYCYVVEEGEERFLGFGLYAKSREDLNIVAAATDATIEELSAPGGGVCVRLKEPNGYDIDLVYGIRAAEPIEVPRQPLNSAARPFARTNEFYRLNPDGPTPVRRLAHVVIATPQVGETVNWFKETLGLISSDDVVAGPEKDLFGSFMRVDEGDKFVDHHSVFVISHPTSGLQHVSFEVQDLDAVFRDHHYLKSLGRYEHLWGIGRHLLGSQVFDYWSNPFGYSHEHWADTDRLNADVPSNVCAVEEGLINQWGDAVTSKFRQGVKV